MTGRSLPAYQAYSWSFLPCRKCPEPAPECPLNDVLEEDPGQGFVKYDPEHDDPDSGYTPRAL